jgi:hypothetical protein
VKWAGAQTAARAVGNAVLGNSRQVLEEAKQQIMLEYDQIYSWFTLQDIDAIDDACADALLSVLEEREPSFPTLEAKPSSVRFQYQVSVIGASFLPKPILDRVTQIYQTFVTQVQNKAPDDHFAFYLKIKNSSSVSYLDQLIDGFEGKRLAGSNDSASRMQNVFNLVAAKVKDDNVKRLVSFIQGSSPWEVRADQVIQTRILNELNFKVEDLRQWYVPGNPIIHFENTPVAERLEKLLGNVALGNDGRVHVTKLEFDLTTYTVSAVVDVRHRHSWGSLRQLLGP